MPTTLPTIGPTMDRSPCPFSTEVCVAAGWVDIVTSVAGLDGVASVFVVVFVAVSVVVSMVVSSTLTQKKSDESRSNQQRTFIISQQSSN